jgi:hypothetical protein
MHLFHKLTLCVFLLFSVLACRSTDDMTPTPTSQAEVEIDITSGLPSPKWTLSDSEVEVLEQTLGGLPSSDSTSFFDGLGYRGFVITFTSSERLIRVQNGHVLVEEAGAQKTYVDTDNQLEKWLLGVSKPHIEPQMYSLLEENIGG